MSKIFIMRKDHNPEPTSFENIGGGEFFVMASDKEEKLFLMVDGDEDFNAVEIRPEFSGKQSSRYRQFRAEEKVFVTKVDIEYSLI